MNPIAELRRRLDNMLRLGTIAELDHAKALCRIKSGSITTGWLPWLSLRAGTTKRWCPPSLGEQCIVFSPSGELAQGIALVGIYSSSNPAPGSAANLDRTTYPDGAVIEYDATAHRLRAQLPAGGQAELITSGGINIVGDITLTGTLTASVDVIANSISLVEHVHGEVMPGSANTGAPK